MSEPLSLKPATRQGIKPTIGLYSESGNGKTYSSLLLARGIAGPTGKIALVDTENGRGQLYADMPLFGGYDVVELSAPYSPYRYCEALDVVESCGAAVGIIDSGSHEWEGECGILDMAAANEEESKRAGLHNWKRPKLEHAKFVQRLMRCKVPLIICLRAKFKTRQGKENGRTVIVKDDHTSPIQAEDFLFELTAHGEILPNHSLRLTKWSHPGLKACFPDGKPIEIKHGQAIAQWCDSPGIGSPTGTSSAPSSVATVKALKKQLWDLLTGQAGKDLTVEQAQQWLWDENLMGIEDHMSSASADMLAKTIDKVQAKLGGGK